MQQQETEINELPIQKTFLRKNIKNIVAYSVIVLLLGFIIYFPTEFCNGKAFCWDIGGSVLRAYFAAPLIFLVFILKEIKTLQTFIEFMLVVLLSLCGAIIPYQLLYLLNNKFTHLSELPRLLNDQSILMFFCIVWTALVIGFICSQKFLTSFSRRVIFYVPILFCGLFISFVSAGEPPRSAVATPISSCFPEKTLVWSLRGNIPIGLLKAGDKVFAHDILNKNIVEVSVNNVIKSQNNKLIKINNELEATPEHPMAVVSNGKIEWKQAGEIGVGDCLVSESGNCIKVNTLTRESVPSITVVNLSVESPNNFFVLMGENHVLVHNKQAITEEMRASADAHWAFITEINTLYPQARMSSCPGCYEINPEGGERKVFSLFGGSTGGRLPYEELRRQIEEALGVSTTSPKR